MPVGPSARTGPAINDNMLSDQMDSMSGNMQQDPVTGTMRTDLSAQDGGIAPAQNATQRWQAGTIRPLSPQRRYFLGTNRTFIDAQATPSPSGTMPSDVTPPTQRNRLGFTPKSEWDSQFTPQIDIPKATRPASGYIWEKNRPTWRPY